MNGLNPKNTEMTKLQTKGSVPDWIAGKLVRNGPALFHLDSQKLRHWFDGYGMLHGFLIQNGEVYYQSKYIESDEYLNARSSGKVPTVAWGTASDPCRSLFRRFQANFSARPDNTNVNVLKIGEKYYTSSDIATINEFDVDSLDTLSNLTATKNGVMAAHPSYSADGSVWNMTSTFGPRVKNTVVSIDDSPAITSHASFSLSQLYYYHSFGNTDRYLISIEQPMKLDFAQLAASGITNKSFYECFSWDANDHNRLRIFDRQTGTISTIETESRFFFFHTINSFEKNGKIFIDVCGYDDNSIVDDFYMDNLATDGIANKNKARLRRLEIDIVANEVLEHDLRVNIELPNINDTDKSRREYRYVYGVHSPTNSNQLAAEIIKYDFKEDSHTIWGEDHLTPGEPIFINEPTGKDEDSGALVVLCHNSKTQRAELVILDAKSLKKIASADIPQQIPPALHGWFYKHKSAR